MKSKSVLPSEILFIFVFHKKSNNETKFFMTSIYFYLLGENVDIIEPDVNCGYEEMVWISESKIKSLGKQITSIIITNLIINFCIR